MAEDNKLIPGAFYWSKQPGGWADGNTGIHFPGPIVKIDKVTRQIIGVDSMPSPVQLPTHKKSFSLENPKEQVECAFDRYDSEALCEGLNLALQTNNIERVPNEVVSELYPKAWERRRDRIVFKRTAGLAPSKPLGDLLNDFMQTRRVRLSQGVSTVAQDQEKENERDADRIRRFQLEQSNANTTLISSNAQSELAPLTTDQTNDEYAVQSAAPAPPPPPPLPGA